MRLFFQHSISKSKEVADVESSKSNDIYISSLGKFCSAVTRKFFPKFLSLLVSCYSSKVLLTFYLAFLASLISYCLLTQSNCVVLNLNILAYIFLLFLDGIPVPKSTSIFPRVLLLFASQNC